MLMDTQSTMYAAVVDKVENLRIRIPADLVEPFAKACEDKRVSKQQSRTSYGSGLLRMT